MSVKQFSARGKLLLSGEYTVLLGAKALAIPSSYGQHLHIQTVNNNLIDWQSLDYKGNIWFSAQFDLNFHLIESNSASTAKYLQKLIARASKMSVIKLGGFKATTRLDFPNNWGLGSSSTLVYLVARLFEVDPMALFFDTSVGSGYDVACAGQETPILYQLQHGKPHWQTVTLPPPFSEVYFIHLNKKQESSSQVKKFLEHGNIQSTTLDSISEITDKLLLCQNISELKLLMDDHEEIMSSILQTPTVRELYFSDFKGSIKSLGAWGGDFIMAVGEDVAGYFSNKGYSTILSINNITPQ